MYAKSLVAVLAAIAALGCLALESQASPLAGEVYEVCQGTGVESYCRVLKDDDDEDDDEDDAISLIGKLLTDDSDDE